MMEKIYEKILKKKKKKHWPEKMIEEKKKVKKENPEIQTNGGLGWVWDEWWFVYLKNIEDKLVDEMENIILCLFGVSHR